MRLRWLSPTIVALALVGSACGTSDLELVDSAAGATDAPAVAATSTSESAAGGADSAADPDGSSTSTTTITTTTTTTTTTTMPIVSLAYDEEGVPINGQATGVLLTPDGWRVPVLGATATGWRVWTPCGREADVTVGTVVEKVDVVLDPGHGGREPGATGANGLIEADLNLAVASMAAERLEAAGYTVMMTRVDDVRVPIVTRAEIALAVDALAVISVHHNAGTDAPAPDPGTEMFHQVESAESRRLAGLLYEETVAALRGFDAAWVSMSDAGALVRTNENGGDFYGMLRRPAGVASVISEAAYLSNPSEAALLARADVQEALAGAVAAGFVRFASTADPGSGFTDDPIFRGYGSSGTGRTTNCDDPVLR